MLYRSVDIPEPKHDAKRPRLEKPAPRRNRCQCLCAALAHLALRLAPQRCCRLRLATRAPCPEQCQELDALR
eukprot:8207085-Lingulodinium_polyedra.AAC.1